MRQTKITDFLKTNLPAVQIKINLPVEKPQIQPALLSNQEEEQKQIKQIYKEKKIHHISPKTQKKKKEFLEVEKSQDLGIKEKTQEVQTIKRKRGRPKLILPKKPINQMQDESLNIRQKIDSQKQNKNQAANRNSHNMGLQNSLDQQDPSDFVPISMQIILPKQEQRGYIPNKGEKPQNAIQSILQYKQLELKPIKQKIYTVPKTETNQNYKKYYDQIMLQTKQDKQINIPLIFNKFQSPQEYKQLISLLK